MFKLRKIFSSLLSLALISGSVLASSDPSDWNNVRILEVGTGVVVKTKAGEKYEGDLKSTTADSMLIVVDNSGPMMRTVNLTKSEVKEVRTKLSRLASGAITTGAGLAAGLAVGAVVDAKDRYGEDPGLGKLIFGTLGTVIGALLGIKASFTGKRVYRAR